MYYNFFFFFSSRRRHTRCGRDWSSDVCSSDLQSIVSELNDRNLEPKNWVGKLGAWLSHQFIFSGFGIASFIFVKIFAETGLWFAFKFRASKLRQMMFWDLFALLVVSIALGHFGTNQP